MVIELDTTLLCRGKRKDNGQWVEGYYVCQQTTTYCFEEDESCDPDNTKHYIVFDRMTDWGLPNEHIMVEVIAESVSRCTGVLDRKSKHLIYGGDIVKHYNRVSVGEPDSYVISLILYDEDNCKWIKRNIDGQTYNIVRSGEYEVIGKIFDNPELLERM